MPINDSFTEIISKEGHNKGELTPYLIFKYAIKTEITRKYYERRLKKSICLVLFVVFLLSCFLPSITHTLVLLYGNCVIPFSFRF